MSRHVPRRDRWASHGTDQYRSVEGLLVRRYKGQWWADVAYQVQSEAQPGESSKWEWHLDTLGPFRRPRNAMVESERHATMLRNRYGERLRLETAEQQGRADTNSR
jgi:hypothetical protein